MRKWNSSEISWALYNHIFRGKHIVCAENTYWPGDECDILIVRDDLRLMEVEIKVSRQDLKADKHKDKWKQWDESSWPRFAPRPPPEIRTHPRRIWKHYYALPKDIWKEDLIEHINPCSGIVLLSKHESYSGQDLRTFTELKRQAKPNKEAKPISAVDAIDIARIQNMKYWALVEGMRLNSNQARLDTAASVS